MTEPSDRNLMDAHVRGDMEAFSLLLGRHGPIVLGYLTKMTHNPDHAEDLFQETFRRVHEHAGQFRGEQLRPWLLTIATRTAINRSRQEKKRQTLSLSQPVCSDGIHCPLESTLAADTLEPARKLEQDEQGRMVRRSLMQLPEKQRAALVLSYYHKLTHSQIAEAMDCSVGTVKTHLFRALKRLRTLLPEPAGGIE